jgi:hypothetical protein
MNILATFFAGVVALFSGLLGYTPTTKNAEQPMTVAVNSVKIVSNLDSQKSLEKSVSTTTVADTSTFELLTYSNKNMDLK